MGWEIIFKHIKSLYCHLLYFKPEMVITGDALVLQDNNVVSEQSNFIMSETTMCSLRPEVLSTQMTT